MASITSTGVGSGLDVNTIVSSLMSLEQRPLTLLQTQASTIQTRISAFGTLKSQIANLGDVAKRLASASNWNPLRADSSDTASITATATATATAGKHTLAVSQLAQSQVLASSAFTTSAAVVGTGTLKLELGTTSGTSFTPTSGSTAVSIPIDSAHQTLAGVRDAINAAKGGVTASIVNGTGGARLVLRGSDGAAQSIRLTATDTDGNDTDAAGLSALAFDPAAAAGAGRNLSQTQGAQDALFQLDGVDLSSSTNSASEALEGVTLNLRKVTTAPIDLQVSVETTSVRKNVTDFVNAYNALNSLLQNQTKADPSGASRGALQADSTAVSLLGGLRSMLHGTVSGLSGTNGLAVAGITLQSNGSLAVDDTRIAPLLADPAQLSALFTQAGTGDARGFAVRYQEWADGFTKDTGILAARVEGLKSRVDLNEKQQESLQDRLVRTEARLRAQYQRLDTQMSSLNAQMAQMTSALGLK